MSDTLKFTCSCCGLEHESWPALTFNSPSQYFFLSEEDKDEIAEIGSDFCTITYPDHTAYFIRCRLIQQVNDSCQDLDYGIWVSLSEKSFKNYEGNYHNANHETTYFGWLCNDIPGYEFDDSIPTDVVTQTGDNRPIVVPHDSCDHHFVLDYYNGISKEEALRRISEMMGEE